MMSCKMIKEILNDKVEMQENFIEELENRSKKNISDIC